MTLLEGFMTLLTVIQVAIFALWCVLTWLDRRDREALRREREAILRKGEAQYAEYMAELAVIKTELRRAMREAGMMPQLTLVKKEKDGE
jgi:hypothetical protein